MGPRARGRARAGGSPSLGLGDHLRRARRGSPDPGRSRAAGSGRALGRYPDGPVHGTPGAFVLLIALAVVGIIVGFGIPLRQLTQPGRRAPRAGWARPRRASLKRTPAEEDERRAGRNGRGGSRRGDARRTGATARPVPVGPGTSPGQTGAWGDDSGRSRPRSRAPLRTRRPSPRPAAPAGAVAATAPARRVRVRDPDDVHRRHRLAADQGPDRVRPAAGRDPRRHRDPAPRRRRRDRPPAGRGHHRQEAGRASGSRPGSSGATPARS